MPGYGQQPVREKDRLAAPDGGGRTLVFKRGSGNPDHLLDAPMFRTFINGYTPTEEVVDQVIDKIVGRSAFQGVNPVDPFCGVWGAEF